LHGAAVAQLNPGEGMDRDGGLGGVRGRFVDVVIEHLNGEELLADCVVAVSEEFITMKTFTVFPTLGNFSWS
jgi:hypothetical protein